jgi:predicted tellurium resistance membrane protein TerC
MKLGLGIAVGILSIIVSILIKKPVFLAIVGIYLIRYVYWLIFRETDNEEENIEENIEENEEENEEDKEVEKER